jgi:clan AA aspartic protease
MGHVFVDARLAATGTRQVRVLVDTGASYSLIPSDLARAIGVPTLRRTIEVTLADGRRKRLKIGTVLVRIGRREAGVTTLVGPRGSEPLLGAEALENLGFKVDPRRRKLEPTRTHAVLLVSVRTSARRVRS